MNKPKKPSKRVKGWGYELHLHNADGYCGKILHIDSGKQFSMHFHMIKHETWYVAKGRLALKVIDPKNADISMIPLFEGDVFVVPQGLPHQLQAYEDSDIFEVSTPDDPTDSYRVMKGDSQI